VATPIGVDTVTSLSRRLILPRIVDNVYGSNPLFFRWWNSNKMTYQGGTQIEGPLMYAPMAAGGPYQGYQLLNVAPTDSVKNFALNWRQYYVPVTVDGLTLLRADSPLAVADLLATQFKQAEMQMCDNLGTGLWSDGTNTIAIDGVLEVVDNGTIAPTYAGLTRSSNTWWNAQVDSSTTTLSLLAMQNLWGSCQSGGRAPTILFGTQANYNRYWNLNLANQSYPVAPMGKDMQLAQAGFDNLLFNGAPMLVDSHIPTTGTEGNLFFLNEDYFELVVASRAQMIVQDFQTPVDQDAMVSKMLWAGNLTCGNCARQGKFTAITG
jgi:hypothetical protein